MALVLAIVGALAAVIPFVTFAAWVLFVPAIVLAVITLVRRLAGKGLAVSALVVSGFALLVSIVVVAGTLLFVAIVQQSPTLDQGSPTAESSAPPELSAPSLDGRDTLAAPLGFGETVTVVDGAGTDLWLLTVGMPLDVTADLTADVGAPAHGAFVAVPVTIVSIGSASIDPATEWDRGPYVALATSTGGTTTATPAFVSEKFLSIYDIGEMDPGDNATFYRVFDVDPAEFGSDRVAVSVGYALQIYWAAPAS